MTETDIKTDSMVTKPQEKEEVIIPVKFNKEIKNLTAEEASTLAQKGMKFDLIRESYEKLKGLAEASGKSVPDFLQELEREKYEKQKAELLEKCSGDEALVERIISLEKGNQTEKEEIDEIKKYFPKIKVKDDLPQEVVESSKLKGTLLLDEYLRYLLKQKYEQEKSAKFEENLKGASIGSLKSRKSPISPETQEFIKGLWN